MSVTETLQAGTHASKCRSYDSSEQRRSEPEAPGLGDLCASPVDSDRDQGYFRLEPGRLPDCLLHRPDLFNGHPRAWASLVLMGCGVVALAGLPLGSAADRAPMG